MTSRQGGGGAAPVRAGDAIGFRIRAHHLAAREPADRLPQVAGACGVQDSPPGSAALALNARVSEMGPGLLERLVEERTLLQTWSVRGAPHYFPTADAAVFTTGVLPADEAARRHLVVGVEQALDRLGTGLDETVDLVAEEITSVLAGRRLAIDELGAELAARVAGRLAPDRRETWQAPGPYGAHQPLGEAVVHFCLRLLTLRGVVCLAPRTGNKAPFVLLREWLDRPLPPVDAADARAELLRRYLRCYGPSTPRDFAAWVGVRPGDADAWWAPLADELVAVELLGRRTWLLAADLDALGPPPADPAVRLLPPHDPYTQLRDRELILDPAHHRDVWRAIGAPGTVLVGGGIAGTWRPRRSGHRLTLAVRFLGPVGADVHRRLREEAALVAGLRGVSMFDLEVQEAT